MNHSNTRGKVSTNGMEMFTYTSASMSFTGILQVCDIINLCNYKKPLFVFILELNLGISSYKSEKYCYE